MLLLAKIRVNKLALELGVSNDQIIDELKEKDYPVKNHMSSIDEEMSNYLREFFSEKLAPKSKKKTTTKKKAATKATTKKKTSTKSETKKAKKSSPPKTTKAKKAESTTDTPKTTKPVKKVKAALKEVDKEKTTDSSKKPQKPGEGEAPIADKLKAAKKPSLRIVKPEELEELGDIKKVKDKPTKKVKESAKTQESKKDESISPDEKSTPASTPAPTEVTEEESFETVQIGENIQLRDLAEKLNCTANDIIKELMGLGVMATINQSLNFEMASKIADQRGFEVEKVQEEEELEFEEEEQDLPSDHQLRPPIVTIMGHVDHGKTSLLDAIRKTNITESEHGGITQHIGAYQAKVKGSSITFLDTPGHEAFTAMRARGAQITDIVVLVVAADDGIKPQTKEAIDHANAANVPLLVAINKIDKPDAKPDEVKKQLAELGLLPEDWGGQTIFTEVSAKMNLGIDNLLELLLLQAEIMELKANPKLRGRGIVIESKLDKGRGPVATVIIQKGNLHVGDPYIIGNYFGKARALTNDQGKNISKATVCMPVEIIGIPEVPEPGDKFMVVKDEKRARQLCELRVQKQRETALAQKPRITMEDLHQQILEGKIHELSLIIKADVQGSIQAVKEALSKLDNDQVRVKVIHDAVGGITESDILLASASTAIIIGFNVRPTEKASIMSSKEKVDVRLYSVIYDAINDIKKAMEGLLEPTFKEKVMGRAEVREVFHIPKVGNIAGCFVLSGQIERNTQARLVRDSVVIYDGKINSLKRFKDDVKEVASGYECGLSFEKYQDLKSGDIIEPYILEKEPV